MQEGETVPPRGNRAQQGSSQRGQPRPPPTLLPPVQFGESQQLRMVRILRSTLMVRVGGGWTALDEFLVKNDPCRGQWGVGRE